MKYDEKKRGLPRESIVGIVGIVATLIATCVGSATTYLVSTKQAEASQLNETEHFRHTQQETAYAEFYSAANQLGTQHVLVLRFLASHGLDDDASKFDAGFDDLENQAHMKLRVVDEKYAVVSLVGSPAAVKASTEVLNFFMGPMEYAMSDALDAVRSEPSSSTASSEVDRYRRTYSKAMNLALAFVQSARCDVADYSSDCG